MIVISAGVLADVLAPGCFHAQLCYLQGAGCTLRKSMGHDDTAAISVFLKQCMDSAYVS